MAFKCPACEGGSLEIELSMELPWDGGAVERSVAIVKCEGCGFRGISVYEESRRGSMDSESFWSFVYEVSEKDLQLMASGFALCPDHQNKDCQCETHLSWGTLHWLFPKHVTTKRWFRMDHAD